MVKEVWLRARTDARQLSVSRCPVNPKLDGSNKFSEKEKEKRLTTENFRAPKRSSKKSGKIYRSPYHAVTNPKQLFNSSNGSQ